MMNKEEILKKINAVFCDIFDDDELILNENTGPDDIDDWDSLAQISLIAALENEFSIRFDIKTALQMKTVGEMVSAIEQLSAR